MTDMRAHIAHRWDLICEWIASVLPNRVRYWVFLQLGYDTFRPNELVNTVPYVTILGRIPRR